MVGGFALTLGALGPQLVEEILHANDSFAISVAGESSSSSYESSFVNLEVHLVFRGVLFNLHLTVAPTNDWHTASYYIRLTICVLDANSRSWRKQVAERGFRRREQNDRMPLRIRHTDRRPGDTPEDPHMVCAPSRPSGHETVGGRGPG